LLVAACNGSRAIDLSGTWPDNTPSFDQVTRAWTRGDKDIRDFDSVLEVQATFKSPEWRVAYVEMLASRLKLPAEERAKLLDEQRQQAAEFHEFEVLMSTYVSRENDLQRGPKSIWRVILSDDQGNEVTPASIARDRTALEVIREIYPVVPDFSQAYIVKFPTTIELLRPNASAFSLRIGGSRGAVALEWRN
jgi:hypothetical protein